MQTVFSLAKSVVTLATRAARIHRAAITFSVGPQPNQVLVSLDDTTIVLTVVQSRSNAAGELFIPTRWLDDTGESIEVVYESIVFNAILEMVIDQMSS